MQRVETNCTWYSRKCITRTCIYCSRFCLLLCTFGRPVVVRSIHGFVPRVTRHTDSLTGVSPRRGRPLSKAGRGATRRYFTPVTVLEWRSKLTVLVRYIY